MSIPVHFNGSLLNIMGGNSTPPVSSGASLSITSFGIYKDSGFTTLLTNGTDVADLGYTPGSYTGAPYSGITGHSPPMAGSIAAAGPPSSFSITATDQFSNIFEVTQAVWIQFNASYQQSSYPTGTSAITAEVKLHDDTGSLVFMDWLPDGTLSAPSGTPGSVTIADPFSLNTTIATASLTSGLFQVKTAVLVAGHTYTLTVKITVTNS